MSTDVTGTQPLMRAGSPHHTSHHASRLAGANGNATNGHESSTFLCVDSAAESLTAALKAFWAATARGSPSTLDVLSTHAKLRGVVQRASAAQLERVCFGDSNLFPLSLALAITTMGSVEAQLAALETFKVSVSVLSRVSDELSELCSKVFVFHHGVDTLLVALQGARSPAVRSSLVEALFVCAATNDGIAKAFLCCDSLSDLVGQLPRHNDIDRYFLCALLHTLALQHPRMHSATILVSASLHTVLIRFLRSSAAPTDATASGLALQIMWLLATHSSAMFADLPGEAWVVPLVCGFLASPWSEVVSGVASWTCALITCSQGTVRDAFVSTLLASHVCDYLTHAIGSPHMHVAASAARLLRMLVAAVRRDGADALRRRLLCEPATLHCFLTLMLEQPSTGHGAESTGGDGSAAAPSPVAAPTTSAAATPGATGGGASHAATPPADTVGARVLRAEVALVLTMCLASGDALRAVFRQKAARHLPSGCTRRLLVACRVAIDDYSDAVLGALEAVAVPLPGGGGTGREYDPADDSPPAFWVRLAPPVDGGAAAADEEEGNTDSDNDLGGTRAPGAAETRTVGAAEAAVAAAARFLPLERGGTVRHLLVRVAALVFGGGPRQALRWAAAAGDAAGVGASLAAVTAKAAQKAGVGYDFEACDKGLKLVLQLARSYGGCTRARPPPARPPLKKQQNVWAPPVPARDHERRWSIACVERSDLFIFSASPSRPKDLSAAVAAAVAHHRAVHEALLKCPIGRCERRCFLGDLHLHVLPLVIVELEFMQRFAEDGNGDLEDVLRERQETAVDSGNLHDLYQTLSSR